MKFWLAGQPDSNKNECYFISIHFFNANTSHNCMQLKLRDFLKTIRSLPNDV